MSEPDPTPACWSCRARFTVRRVDAETVLRGRAAAEGGPFRVFRCPSCGVENGVIAGPPDARGPSSARMLHPLSGRDPPSLLDRVLSRAERSRLERSRVWWRHNGDAVGRFRRGDLREAAAAGPAPTERSPRPRRVAAVSGPRAVLGVADDAPLTEIRRAFRRLAKRLHPDHAAREGLTPAEAAARFRDVRAAYDALAGRSP